ncbi:MAG: ABC transporter ATP-binding protein [Firmicutes bacterium]|nr:ABC transporter ATP-binding protein [Bacillota bacterium]
MEYAIEAIGLGKASANKWLIRDVNLRIRRSALYYLVGQNGSGKTTLLGLLAGLLRPSSGTATVFGRQVWGAGPEVLSRIGFAPADGGYYPNLTVDQNLVVAAAIRRGSDRKAIDEAVAALDLCPLRGRRAGSLSKGQKKRLAIACALVGYPEVVLLDEPYSNLDADGIDVVQKLVSDVCHNRGTTVVASSALPPSSPGRTATIGVIHEGRFLGEWDISDNLSPVDVRAMLRELTTGLSGGRDDNPGQG